MMFHAQYLYCSIIVFEPDDLGSSLELDHIPEIGTMSDIIISDIIASDSDEMRNTHYRFDDDVMGSPKFAGIRIDAEKESPNSQFNTS